MSRSLLAPTWAVIVVLSASSVVAEKSLISNTTLRCSDPGATAPDGFEITGDVAYGDLTPLLREHSGWGVRLLSGAEGRGGQPPSGSITTKVSGITSQGGRWYRLRISGLAQEEFHVEREDVYLKVEFFKNEGRTPLDQIKKVFYAQVEKQRADLADPGTNKKLGSATWRSFALEFRTPFPEVDTFQVSAGFGHGAAKGKRSEFWINSFELKQIEDPSAYVRRKGPDEVPTALSSLVPLGGRWYFDPRGGDRKPPAKFDHTNADRLVYRSDSLIAPFSGNTTAWLRQGYLDLSGDKVKQDKFLADNVVITVTDEHVVVKSKNIPNHPTAVFPDRWRALDGNPNYIAEKNLTWYLPLEPRENRSRVAMKNEANNDHALPMGPIGIAVNGVVFFNPFDHLLDEDAVWRVDRCCGHPAPNSLYHYHKYPVCVKSPWTDDGGHHSPVIGFAFDGYPVYGPYEAAGQLAKELKTNPLNEFNVHYDKQRGWHYHVTPGEFPHIIGGYWGVVEVKNRRGRGPGAGGRAGPGGPRRGPPRPRGGAPRP